jgi:carbonic anhydrase
MRFLPELFANNREWAARQVERDPAFFQRLCDIQRPEHLWIGCADSRVPANQIVGLEPGEMFVHRNVGNVVRIDDENCMSVVQYAVDILKVSHIIVCGHYNCGGVLAALGPEVVQPLESWLVPIRDARAQHAAELDALPDDAARWHRLCELNVIAQVASLAGASMTNNAWRRGHELVIHGWIYDLRDGLLRDLEVSINGPPDRDSSPGSRLCA